MKFTKTLAGVLSVMMCASVPGMALISCAEEASDTGTFGVLTYQKYEDYVEIIGCDASAEGQVVIPAGIEGLPVKRIGAQAFYDIDGVTSVIMCNGVTSIGQTAFWSCSSLKEVHIPDTVTSIESYAFSNCHALESVKIPEGITEIMNDTFTSCFKLKSITIPDSVTTIGQEAFSHCAELTSVILPEHLENIGMQAFSGCYSLESITIPESITEIPEAAFSGCTSLKDINLPDTVVTIERNAFENCESLAEITIPVSVSSIGGWAFASCKALEAVTILNPDCDICDDYYTFTNYMTDGGAFHFDGTIYGYENSTAQAYAEKYGKNFALIASDAVQPGDVNQDNSIDIMDVILINKAIFGKAELSESQIKAADIDGSGAPDSTDALTIMKYIIKLIDSLD